MDEYSNMFCAEIQMLDMLLNENECMTLYQTDQLQINREQDI